MGRKGSVLVAALTLSLFAAPALADPITVWLDRQHDYTAVYTGSLGLEDASAQALNDAGAPTFEPGILFSQEAGGIVVSVPNPIPGNPFGTSRTSPSTASSTAAGGNPWQVTAPLDCTYGSGDNCFDDLWILFVGHGENDPIFADYDSCGGAVSCANPGVVGLEVDPMGGWALIEPDPSGAPDFFYVGFLLGDLLPGETKTLDVEYRVAKNLQMFGGTFMAPRFDVLFATRLQPAPEPGLVLLLGAAAAGLACRRLRR